MSLELPPLPRKTNGQLQRVSTYLLLVTIGAVALAIAALQAFSGKVAERKEKIGRVSHMDAQFPLPEPGAEAASIAHLIASVAAERTLASVTEPPAAASPSSVGYIMVLHEGTHLPLARVSLHLSNRTSQSPDRTIRTDYRGLARVVLDSDCTFHGIAQMGGYSSGHFTVNQSHADPGHALVLLMRETCSLRGLVTDEKYRPLGAAAVHIVAQREYSEGGLLIAEAFGKARIWSGITDSAGKFEVAGLEPSVRLGVEVRLEGRRVPQEDVILEAGEVREVVYRIFDGTLLRGLLVDSQGAPCANAQLWLVIGDESRPLKEYEDVLADTRTGPDGGFQFENVPPNSWVIGPSFASNLLSWGTHVEIPVNTSELDVVLRLPDPYFVSGLVIDPEGNPVPDVGLAAYGAGGAARGRSKSDGSFSLGPFAEGPVGISATSVPTGYADGQLVEIEAGATDLVLQLISAGSMIVRVLDSRGHPGRGEVLLQRVQEGEVIPVRASTLNARGICQFANMAPGIYSVHATSFSGQKGISDHVEVVVGVPVEVQIEVR